MIIGSYLWVSHFSIKIGNNEQPGISLSRLRRSSVFVVGNVITLISEPEGIPDLSL